MDRCSICNGLLTFEHDHQPDQSGLDDGPPLPRSTVNLWRKPAVIDEWKAGATLRDLAAKYGISHETVRAWTEQQTRKTGASRRPQHGEKSCGSV